MIYKPTNMSEIKVLKKYKKLMLSLTLMNIFYGVISFVIIYLNRNEFNKLNLDIIVSLDPQFDTLLFLSIVPFFLNACTSLSFYNQKFKNNFKSKKITRVLIFLIFLNIIFGVSFFNNLTYGYIAKDEIMLKNSFLGTNKYEIKDIKYAEISLEYKASVDNYYIDYNITFKNNKELNLRQFDSCTYESLMVVTENFEQKGIDIKREKLSQETADKVIRWSNQYNHSLSFKYLLGL